MCSLFFNFLFAAILLFSSTLALSQSSIILDADSPGRTFEGIGAVSAGASSRLLIDYPEPQRSEILDYLFKPGYGAAFQHLKVEVGGDVNSTDGTEPSHMRTRDEENYQRGYEWWLMKEAKKRNPNIILDCLAWGAPAWIGGGKFFSQDMVDYYVKFVQGAKKEHGLDLNLIGIWNERPYDAGWIKLLRQTLDQAGLQRVKIVAADLFQKNKWDLADQFGQDPALKAAVYAVGAHYPKFNSTPQAQDCGLPLWSSEDGPWRGDWKGAVRLARMYNRNYIKGKISKTEVWSPITSYYDNLPLPNSGVMLANSPWSGNYEVQPALWCTAHTTHFAQPGWTYIDSACVLLPGGSVVALRSPDKQNYSLIIETTEAKTPQTVTFRFSGEWPEEAPSIWRTTSKEVFKESGKVQIKDHQFRITLEPGAVYSITTLKTVGKGDARPPAKKAFPLPYSDDFESYAISATPRYLSDFSGAFEVVNREDGKGKTLRQVITAKGIEWQKNALPETFLGESSWRNYEVSVDVLVEMNGMASLFGRVGKIEQTANPPWGFWLKVETSGQWELVSRGQKEQPGKKGKKTAGKVVLASGTMPFEADQWHTLKLNFQDNTIKAFIDGNQVANVTSDLTPVGMVGIGSGWNAAQFDNLTINGTP